MALRLLISGRVQGVGYRAWAVGEAEELGLAGFVRNRRDGSVEILVRGPAAEVERFVAACHRGPWGAAVSRIEVDEADEDIPGTGFRQAATV